MRHKTSIAFETSILSEIDKLAKKRKVSRNDIVNDFCRLQLQLNNAKEVEEVYAPIINRFMEENFKSFENRIAGLMAKSSLDSAMSMFMLLDSISRSRNVSTNELYQKTRGMAVKHVQKREDLVNMMDKSRKDAK